MKKEWLKHYVLAFMFLGLIVISILMLFSQIRLAGFAVYGANEACITDITESSYFSDTQTCDTAKPIGNGLTGPNISANNVVLNCSFYTLIGSSAQGFGIMA